MSLHSTTTNGDVDGPVFDSSTSLPAQVGSSVDGRTALAKLRYVFGNNGGGYAELSFHDQGAVRDISAAPSSFPDPAVSGPPGLPVVAGFEGSALQSHNAGYGLDVHVPLGATDSVGTESGSLLFRDYTSLVSQSVFGPAAGTSPYLYNDRDRSGENSLEFDKQFSNGSLTLQYSIRNENLTVTNYDNGDINLQSIIRRSVGPLAFNRRIPSALLSTQLAAADQNIAASGADNTLLGQTQRAAGLRYSYDPTAKLHITAAAYYSDYSTFGRYTDPRFGFVYTPDARSAFRFSVWFNVSSASATRTLCTQCAAGAGHRSNHDRQSELATRSCHGIRTWRFARARDGRSSHGGVH